MKPERLNVYIGSVFILLIGMSLTISTLHSHHHIQWDHPEEFTDTGHCITSDTTVCPICGYLFKVDLTGPVLSQVPVFSPEVIHEPALLIVQNPHLFYTRGRSPPALV